MSEPLEVSCARCGRPTLAVRSKSASNNEMDCCPHCDRIVDLEMQVDALLAEMARRDEQIADLEGELEKVQGFLRECHKAMDYHGITGAWRPS